MYQSTLIARAGDPMEWTAKGITPSRAVKAIFEMLEAEGFEVPEEEIQETLGELCSYDPKLYSPWIYERREFSDPEGNFDLTITKILQ